MSSPTWFFFCHRFVRFWQIWVNWGKSGVQLQSQLTTLRSNCYSWTLKTLIFKTWKFKIGQVRQRSVQLHMLIRSVSLLCYLWRVFLVLELPHFCVSILPDMSQIVHKTTWQTHNFSAIPDMLLWITPLKKYNLKGEDLFLLKPGKIKFKKSVISQFWSCSEILVTVSTWYTPELDIIFWWGPKGLIVFLHDTKVPQKQKVVSLNNALPLTADKMYSLKGNKCLSCTFKK